MLAERGVRGRPLSLTALGAALALGLGLASAAAPPAARADDSAIQLALVVPIVAPPSEQPFLDSTTLEQYTSAQGVLTRELNAAYGKPVTLAIDPRIIASIRLLGSSAPPSATAWLERLSLAPNPSFALAWADADATVMTQGGAGEVLRPESLDFAIDPALFAATDQTPAPSSPTVPTSDEVLDWPYTLTGIAWPRDDSVVAADIPLIAASGYDTVLLSSGNVSRDASTGAVASLDGAGAVVSDVAVSAALRSATTALLPEEWSAALADLSNSLAAASRVQSGTPTVVATFDRSVPASGNRLGELLDTLAADPTVSLIPLSSALTASSPPASIVDMPQPVDRVSRAGQMIAGGSAERSFATVASQPTLITSERRLQLLTLFSTQWLGDPQGWPTAADAFTTDSIDLRNAVRIVKSSNFLLVADNDQYLPIAVDNKLDQPATVYVTVRSTSGLLAIDDSRVKLEIEANAQGKVNVPVRSLSNGVVDVDVSLTSPAGVAIGTTTTSSVNVQAGWETPIVVAIAIAVVLVFGFGLVRTVLRRRKLERD